MQLKEENMYLNIHGRINYINFFKIDLLTDFAALGIGVLSFLIPCSYLSKFSS
jgi:hypothetical protein